ncbi:MAG: hypothetical protein WD607_11535 [Candidatus Paceibacterota bacterium]
MADFEVEEIPDEDSLYMRVHKNWIRDGELNPGTFRNNEGGMSTDWSKYSDPEQTRNRVIAYDKEPDNYGILGMNVGDVRKIPDQVVIHKPLDDNRSHTDVEGVKETKQRVLYLEIVNWEITLPNLNQE